SGGLRVLFMSSSLDQAEAVIELGINPAAHVRIFERDLGYDRQKPTAEEHARIEAIKHDDADNKAVRLAMVTEEVASAGLAHDAMLDKTLRQIEMAGGVDRLDGVAARFKFGPGEWEGLKRFLAYGAAVRDLTRGAGAEAAPVQAGLTPQG
ncbi:MAG: hypothetical protein P4M15_14620, partial [Alphaproteobacteria bacterium]|nr:hypothetical protein [Alphaproteobacteria bacterium]